MSVRESVRAECERECESECESECECECECEMKKENGRGIELLIFCTYDRILGWDYKIYNVVV